MRASELIIVESEGEISSTIELLAKETFRSIKKINLVQAINEPTLFDPLRQSRQKPPFIIVVINSYFSDYEFLSQVSRSAPLVAVLDIHDSSEREAKLISVGVQEIIYSDSLSTKNLYRAFANSQSRFMFVSSALQSEQIFKALGETLTFQMAYRIVVPTGGQARFEYVSEGVMHISGLTVSQVKADPQLLYDQILKEDRSKLDELERRAVERLEPLEVELRKVDTQGRMRWIRIRSVPSKDNYGNTIWDGVETDVSAYKLAEREIKHLLHFNQNLLSREREARERLEQTNKLKDKFLATLSHELRTPINAVLGWSQLIQKGLLTGIDLDRAIDTIERNARLQAKMISDLLDVSRIISCKLKLDFETIDIRQIMIEVTDSLQPAAQTKAISLTLQIDPELTALVNAERERLYQVFFNIISNSIKFTPHNGTISILVYKSSDSVCVDIIDSGIGMKADVIPLIFDCFGQADTSITRRHDGLGLGLSIAKQLLELHHGTIVAQSAGEGLGSKFSVTLPVALTANGQTKQTPLTSELKRTMSIQLNGISVLLVDDQIDSLELAEQIIKSAGGNVTTASSAEQALELFKRDRVGIDIIVSDIGMPIVDGIEMLRLLKEHSLGGFSIPSIALTAFASNVDRTRILSSGFDYYLTKPVNAEELIEAIKILTDKQAVEQ